MDINEQIHDLNITEVIKSYAPEVDLKKSGTTYQALCPFHNEKTPSFHVTPSKGIYKCFGCGKGGDAISFVMEHQKMTYWEAVTDIAQNFNLELPKMSQKDKEKKAEEHQQRETLRYVLKFANDYFQNNLKANPPPYIKQRISPETAKAFEVGYASDSFEELREKLNNAAIKENYAIDAGVLANKNGKVYDFFRNRMMFPVYDHRNQLCGFSGRDIKGDQQAKYLNTSGTLLFQKSKLLFGLHLAKKAIEKNDMAYLVEGNTDVTTLHSFGITNTVAPLGTAFTDEQAKLLKKFSKNITLIADGDNTGLASIAKSGKIAVQQGMNAYVIQLPEDHDPDDYFISAGQFEEYEKENSRDFIFWYATNLVKDNPTDPNKKADAIEKVCNLLMQMSETKADLYIEQLATVIKPKKQWQSYMKSLRQESTSVDKKDNQDTLPQDVDSETVEKYGFYEHENRYFFRSKEGGYYPVSNFVLKPLFHIKLVNDSSRLFEMTNMYGKSEIIEVDIQSMVSIQMFKRVIESRGNYLWEGTEVQFNRLKRKLYDNTKTCELIENLGQQSEGFYAFVNGIFNGGKWKPIDDKGIVAANNKYYFIPALSDIYKDDKTIYLSDRRFKYIPRSDIDINSWSKLFIKVFGDNARIAICFWLATLFKDYIFNQFKFFPMLNAFGPPSTGKSQMGWSLMYLFGEAQNPYNLHNGTKVGLAEHLAEFSNALAWIDEYKNAVDYDKIEMLKSAYDGIGRKKGGIEKGKKTKVSTINAGIVITGQEMPTADVALLKRVILLQFYQDSFSKEELANHDKLKEIEKGGLSQLNLEVLQYREQFEKEFYKIYDQVSSDLSKDLQDVDVEDRIMRNMCIILSAFRFFEDKLPLNMTYDELRELFKQNIIDQSSFILNSAELRSFWDIIESALENNQIVEGNDFKIDYVKELPTTDRGKQKFQVALKVIYMKFSRIYEIYAETMRRTGQHPLPKTTLIFYLKTSKEYLGMKKAESFKNPGSNKRQLTNAYTFKYDDLNLSLEREDEDVIPDGKNAASNDKENKKDDGLPF